MTNYEAIKQLEDLEGFVFREAGELPNDLDMEALGMAIEALKKQQWIPCSERLPEAPEGFYMVSVLVVDKSLYEHDMPYPYLVAKYCPEDYYEINPFTGKKQLVCEKGWQNELSSIIPTRIDPIAWMPFPEPYKAGDSE